MKTTIEIYRNDSGKIYGFKAFEHTDKIICSAISMLTINTVNSIETLTDEKFECSYDEKGGYLHFIALSLKDNTSNCNASLLLDSMFLGLVSIKQSYPKLIKIVDDHK